MRPVLGRRPRPVDLALALALTVAMQVEVWAPDLMPGVGEVTGSRPLLAVTGATMSLALVARQIAPVAVLGIVLASASIQSVFTTPTEGLASLATLLVATYSASAYPPWRRTVVSALFVVAGVAVVGENSGDHAFLAIVLGAVWLTGFVVGQRSEEVVRLSDSNRDLAERLATAGAMLSEAQQRSVPGRAPAPNELATLTVRELEVVRAMATGRSNAEIAAFLVISEWTVKTHVASILRKLGLRDRAQVVVAAYESGLTTPGQDHRGTATA
jgi:DNA-binding CsgD family transcriptional regulator